MLVLVTISMQSQPQSAVPPVQLSAIVNELPWNVCVQPPPQGGRVVVVVVVVELVEDELVVVVVVVVVLVVVVVVVVVVVGRKISSESPQYAPADLGSADQILLMSVSCCTSRRSSRCNRCSLVSPLML